MRSILVALICVVLISPLYADKAPKPSPTRPTTKNHAESRSQMSGATGNEYFLGFGGMLLALGLTGLGLRALKQS